MLADFYGVEPLALHTGGSAVGCADVPGQQLCGDAVVQVVCKAKCGYKLAEVPQSPKLAPRDLRKLWSAEQHAADVATDVVGPSGVARGVLDRCDGDAEPRGARRAGGGVAAAGGGHPDECRARPRGT